MIGTATIRVLAKVRVDSKSGGDWKCIRVGSQGQGEPNFMTREEMCEYMRLHCIFTLSS